MRTRTLALTVAVVLAAGLAAATDLPPQVKSAPAIDLAQVVHKAEVLAARQSWNAAIATYREALAASPKDAALHNKLGICYQRKGDAKQAQKEYRKAIDLRADYAEAWNNLGTLEHARGKYTQAISAYAKAIKIKPSDAVFFKNLGAAWLAREDMEKALEAWNEAYRIDPLCFDSEAVGVPATGVTLARQYYLYAKLLAARGENEKALDYLTRARAQGFKDFAKVEKDKDFAGVVSDPRYVALK
jgi:Flp pilus assembly protein TadD